MYLMTSLPLQVFVVCFFFFFSFPGELLPFLNLLTNAVIGRPPALHVPTKYVSRFGYCFNET